MQVAVVGGGAAGLLTAWLIQEQHEVTVYEARPELGGHVRTVRLDDGGSAEAGFKYFFDRTNPNLLAVFDMLELGVHWTDAAMNLPHASVDGVVVLPPKRPHQLAKLLTAPAALRDLICLSVLRMAYDRVVLDGDRQTTVEELLRGPLFPASCHPFLYSFISSSWGAPADVMAKFPAFNVLTLLSSPGARYKRVGHLEGGSITYIHRLAEQLDRCRLAIGEPVERIERDASRWRVVAEQAQTFDAVVLALPPWHGAAILHGAERFREALTPFRSFDTEIAVHRDRSFMPEDRRDWTLSNVYTHEGRFMLTSWEGLLQDRDLFRSWLVPGVEPRLQLCRESFEHLIVDADSRRHREALHQRQGEDGLYAVGMYTGDVDCHESCVTSALAAASRLAPASSMARRLHDAAGRRARQEARDDRERWARLFPKGSASSRHP